MQFNKLIPELTVSNLEKSLEFYLKLGFKLEYRREKPKFAFFSFQGSQLMIEESSRWQTAKPEYPFGRGLNPFPLKSKTSSQSLTP